jgi:hypothetical protein
MLPKPLYTVKLIEKDNQHFYEVDGHPTLLPGVTGILNEISKAFLLKWAAKETALYIQKIFAHIKPGDLGSMDWDLLVRRAKLQHKFIKETAARLGTEAHRKFNLFLTNGMGKIHSDLVIERKPFEESFFFWLKTNKLKIIAGDTKLASLKHGYGGSADAIAEEDGKIVILDFKTGKSIYESHAYQTSAYSVACREQYGLDYYPEAIVIRFEKNLAKYELRRVRSVSDSFRAFRAALELHRVGNLVTFSHSEIIKAPKENKNASTQKRNDLREN